MTPIRLRIASRSSPSARAMSWPPISTRPTRGVYRPMMCLSRTLLPEPEPPRIATTSPRPTSNETSVRTVKSPNPARNPSTWMIGSPLSAIDVASGLDSLDSEVVVEHCEQAVDEYDEHDAAHHCARRRDPDRSRPRLRL